LELIDERWKGYLFKSEDICLQLKLKTCTDEELGRNWQKDLCISTKQKIENNSADCRCQKEQSQLQ
jgi:hypothetical protein